MRMESANMKAIGLTICVMGKASRDTLTETPTSVGSRVGKLMGAEYTSGQTERFMMASGMRA